MRCLVTGASGFVGGHVAERLINEGWQVRTVVRPSSQTELLKQLGVELIEGDLTDPATLRQACTAVDAVVHVAAKVGEWGPIEEYRKVNVEGLQQLFDALKDKPIQRFVLVSSLGVYPARDHHGTDETCELPEKHIDGYTQSKAEADKLALRVSKERNLPLVIVRPGFIYGPRDRTVMPRILNNLRKGRVRFIDNAQKKLNQVYVGNVVEAVWLALNHPNAVGNIYNITDETLVTKDHFFGTIADLVGLPRPTRTLPMGVAKVACKLMEGAGKLFGFEPMLTGAKLKFMGLNLDYSIEKAKKELGYAPKVGFDEGIRKAIDWLKANGEV